VVAGLCTLVRPYVVLVGAAGMALVEAVEALVSPRRRHCSRADMLVVEHWPELDKEPCPLLVVEP